MMARIFLLTALVLAVSMTAHAENWVKYRSMSMKFPAGDTVISGFTESYCDTVSLRYVDSTYVEIWLKHVTFIGDLVPHTTKELIRIDCMNNRFQSLIENNIKPSALTEINKGEIGGESDYRIIKEAYCGVPKPPGGDLSQ
jgi:hypothetical protein